MTDEVDLGPDWRCPMDGEPLVRIVRYLNEPSIFEHRDGQVHEDYMRQLRVK